jgi:hypothetical protein
MLAYIFLCILTLLERFRPRRRFFPHFQQETRSRSMSAPHVHIEDAIRPVASNGGGVFPLRSRQHTGVGSLRLPSVTVAKSVDDDLEDDGYDARDVKKAQVWILMAHLITAADNDTGLRRLETCFPCVSICRCYLWRYRYKSGE